MFQKFLPGWLVAGTWGWISGSALLLGAAMGYWFEIPTRLASVIMSFGSGVLISALSLDLMQEAYEHGGLLPTGIGFIAGAAVYTLANWLLSHHGAKHRKRSNSLQPSESDKNGSGRAIAMGALLDGIPESIVIGLSMLQGAGVSLVAVIAIFLSNLPEGLSSSTGMKKAGRSMKYIFGVWGAICIISGIASLVGYTIFGSFSASVVSSTTAFAAGAILSMIANTMIPEAFEDAHYISGLVVVVGYLTAFTISKLGN